MAARPRPGFGHNCPNCDKLPLLKSCVHQFCWKCCAAECERTSEVCESHAAKLQKRREEDKLVEQVLDGKRKRKAVEETLGARKVVRGEFFETTFEELGDTVSIWSVREYLRRPSYSQDHMENLKRQRRQMSSEKSKGLGSGSVARRQKGESLCDYVTRKARTLQSELGSSSSSSGASGQGHRRAAVMAAGGGGR